MGWAVGLVIVGRSALGVGAATVRRLGNVLKIFR
jgi:hypothetical protein